MNQPIVEPPRLFEVPQGEFELRRRPHNPQLLAWDAADEYLLQHLDDAGVLPTAGAVLIVNDSFGALATALASYRVFSWSDSLLAQLALRDNLRRNGIREDQVETNTGIDFPHGRFDVVLLRLPKSHALLEHQLYALRERLHADSTLVAAAMARHVHSSTLQYFERLIGPTMTTRARKKSRLILSQRDTSLSQGQSPWPQRYTLDIGREIPLQNHASLFSRDRLDRGSRLLLENLEGDDASLAITDLGCGNGVLGIVAAELCTLAELTFVDESHMAVASARANFAAAFGPERRAAFQVDDCGQGLPDASQDRVLINPPFHQQQQTGDDIAWQMLRQARRILRPGGMVTVVGNRHLAYHTKLKKLFGNVDVIASDSKFVLLRSSR